MAKGFLKETKEEELLRLASGRVKFTARNVLLLDYQSDVDLLLIVFDEAGSTHSDDDQERGLIYNYAGKKLVSIEVLDLYGTFAA